MIKIKVMKFHKPFLNLKSKQIFKIQKKFLWMFLHHLVFNTTKNTFNYLWIFQRKLIKINIVKIYQWKLS